MSMKTVVEAFLVQIEAECVRWRCGRLPLVPQGEASHMDRGEGMAAGLRVQGQPPQTPDQAVQLLAQCGQGADASGSPRCLSHSTSWRFEPPDTVVLSYIVCLPEHAPVCSQEPRASPWQEMRLHELQLAHGAMPDAPAPGKIEPRHVLSHALRHLAFLAQGPGADPIVSRHLSGRARRFLAQLPPALAGQLAGPCDQVASRHESLEQNAAASGAEAPISCGKGSLADASTLTKT